CELAALAPALAPSPPPPPSGAGTAATGETDAAWAGLARTTTSTGRLLLEWISSTSSRAPSAGAISPRPSRSNIGFSAPVTIPPSHGPQLNATTRQAESRRAILWAHLFNHSLAAA